MIYSLAYSKQWLLFHYNCLNSNGKNKKKNMSYYQDIKLFTKKLKLDQL